jgi:hypothetical protein
VRRNPRARSRGFDAGTLNHRLVHAGDLVCRCSPRKHETYEIRVCDRCALVVGIGDDGDHWLLNERLYDLPRAEIPVCAGTVGPQRLKRIRGTVLDAIRASRTTCYAFMKDADF